MAEALLVAAAKSAVMLALVLTVCAYMTLFERRLIAGFQLRYGPNRVGPGGLLQPFADAVKLIFKESFRPAGADPLVYWIAPGITMVAALFVYAVIPLGPELVVLGRTVPLVVADVNVGILLVLGASSIGVYGIILGGWAANSKYAMLGSLRSSAQVLSYELVLALAVASVVLSAGTLSLVEIVNAQQRVWFAFTQPVAFLLFLILSILVPLANGRVSERDIIYNLTSLPGLLAVAGGAVATQLNTEGLRLLQADPEVVFGIVLGSILGIVILNGVPVGPLMAAGATALFLKVLRPGRR
ncbi:MAG: DUF441 family protein [Peptococcaceae bacterium]|nr:DUF441 family protein [Peptococcaceae bacterium]